MPRLFSYDNFANGSETVRVFADKHSPVIICDTEAKRNEPFNVKVKIGMNVRHPNTPEHHYEYIQLWNLETLIATVKLQRSSFGDLPIHVEANFTFVPKVSLRLIALAYCNQHGLWQSKEVFVKVKGEEGEKLH